MGPQPLLTLRLPAGAPAWTPLCYQLHTRCFSGYCGKTVQGMSSNLGFSPMSTWKTNWMWGGSGENRDWGKMPCLVIDYYSLLFFSWACRRRSNESPKRCYGKGWNLGDFWSTWLLKKLESSPTWPNYNGALMCPPSGRAWATTHYGSFLWETGTKEKLLAWQSKQKRCTCMHLHLHILSLQ